MVVKKYHILYNASAFFVLMIAGMFLSMFLKNEFFWDFANYHYYNAWAFLNNRLNYDIAPASLNSFFNPIIELPLYFYIKYFNENINLIYALQGIWTGLLLFVFYKIYLLFFELKNAKDYILLFLALILSVCGYATFYQIGSSTNEIPVAFISLWGFYILLKMIKFPEAQSLKKFLLAGLIMGIGLGLKQTMITYCIASGLTLMICYKFLNKPLRSICFFAFGGLVGYLIVNGYFMWQYWELYGNPFFPFLNGIFHSPYFDDFNFNDTRFLPTIKEFFIYPLLWNLSQYNIAEVSVLNFRLSMLYIVMVFILFYYLIKKKTILVPHEKILFIFLFSSFFIWMLIFSITRYSVVIEVLSTILFVQILDYFITKSKHFICSSMFASVIIILLLSPLLDTGWNKRNIDEKKFIDVEKINLPKNTLLQLYNFPSAFLVPVFAQTTELRALGYFQYNCTYQKGFDFLERGKFNQIRQDIENNHKGPKVIVFVDNTIFKNTDITKVKDDIKKCRKKNLCSVTFCKTKEFIEDTILQIPDDYFCKHLENNIDNRLTICVPDELKTQILGERNETI